MLNLTSFSKGSVAFWLIMSALAISFLMFVPLPHYHHDQGWFSGPSLSARIIGSEIEAAPIDSVLTQYVNSNLSNPFDISCSSDLDCKVININTQCKSYCADSAPTNQEIIKNLEKNRVCDPAFYKPEFQNCKCVFNKCLTIDY